MVPVAQRCLLLNLDEVGVASSTSVLQLKRLQEEKSRYNMVSHPVNFAWVCCPFRKMFQ
jgi:hypothetical protein